MKTADFKDAFLILETGESGRPVEFLAQYIASYLYAGELDLTTGFSFLSAILQRVDELLNDDAKIWAPLVPGGMQGMDGPTYRVIEEGNIDDVRGAFAMLDQDKAEQLSNDLWSMPNIGRPESPGLKELGMHDIQATTLLTEAVESGQLRDTMVGMRIVEFLAKNRGGTHLYAVREVIEDMEKPDNITLDFKQIVKPDADTSLFTNETEYFVDEHGVQWVKFVPLNGHDKGKQHMMRTDSIYAVVRDHRGSDSDPV